MAKLAIWNPWGKDPYKELFDRMSNSLSVVDEESSPMNVPLNLWEEEDHYVAALPLPGVKSEDIDISVEDRYLTISGESHKEVADKSKKYHVREISTTSFSRTVMLPGNVNVDKIEAKCEHGILTITMPKQEVSRSKKIKVG